MRDRVAHTVIEGPYLADLLAQPGAILGTVDGLVSSPPQFTFGASNFRFVVLTGMGASFHALAPLHQRLLGGGIASVAIETSELLQLGDSLFRPDILLVVVSQSGRSVEIVRLLETNRARAACIGVTNSPDSPLGLIGRSVVLLHAGEETSVSCKTYVATLVALDWLGDRLLGSPTPFAADSWRDAAAAMGEYLSSWRRHVDAILESCPPVDTLVIIGRGFSLAAAGTGALILKEAAKISVEGLSSAAFRHGPIEMVSSRVLVAVIEGGPAVRDLNRAIALDIQRAGGQSILISAESASPVFRLPPMEALAMPVLEILPFQMMTLAFAARAGIEAGCFCHATKVTSVE